MSGTGTIDVGAEPVVTLDAPVSVGSPEDAGGVELSSDNITDDLLSGDTPDLVEEVIESEASVEEEAPKPAPAPAAAAEPVAPVPAPAAPVADPAVPAPAAAAPVEGAEPSQPQPAAPQTVEEERRVLRENYTRARTEMETALATTHYKLDDAVKAALDSGDTTALSEVIPKVAAKVHMDAMTSAVAHVMQYMPQMLGNLMVQREVETKAQNDFFTAWPQLKMDTHGQVIQRLGLAYRQANPAASAADFIRDVGAQATLALKLPINNGTVPVPAPRAAAFRPAGAGGGGGLTPAPRAELNPFEALALSGDDNDED